MTPTNNALPELPEIEGRRMFAWWPVPIHSRSGYWREGFAWLEPVIKRRRIGHPSYFFTRAEEIE